MTPDLKRTLVRQPAVIGQFYPAQTKKLKNLLARFFDPLKDQPKKSNPPQIILVPHAGLTYSGQTAAYAYQLLKNSSINRVILLGSSHQSFFSGAAVDNSTYWQTPIGQVELDQDLIKTLTKNKLIFKDRHAHAKEHSLEVQLPFLSTVLSDFKIIPILLGQVDNGAIEAISQTLSPHLIDQNTLLVVSTDLSHYPDAATAKTVDQATITSILSLDPQKFDANLADLQSQYPQVDTFACAAPAVKIALHLAQKLNLSAQLLNYSNSADTAGDSSRVVGYAAIAFYPKINQDHQLLLSWSRKVLDSFIKTQKAPPDPAPNSALGEKRGVFITLKKNHDLRGCIGNFEGSDSVWHQVRDMTISAATKDPRFSPVQKDELSSIKIEISILSPLKKVDSIDAIDMGTDGVYLAKGPITGTFLPQVATDTGWSKKEFLQELCSQKMGLASNCYLDPDIDIFTYTVDLISEF